MSLSNAIYGIGSSFLGSKPSAHMATLSSFASIEPEDPVSNEEIESLLEYLLLLLQSHGFKRAERTVD